MCYNKSIRAIHKAVALLRNSPEAQDALVLKSGGSNPELPLTSDTCNSLGLSLSLPGDEKLDSVFFRITPVFMPNSDAMGEDMSEAKGFEGEMAALDYDINECEFTEAELDEPVNTLSPRALYFQRLRSADTQDDARERAAYLAANPPAPRVFDTPPHSLYVRRSAIALGLHSPLLQSVEFSETSNDASPSTAASWSDSEEDELEDLEDLKSFFNSPQLSPSMLGECEIAQPKSPMGSWSDTEDEELEAVEELENFFKCQATSRNSVFA